MKYLRLPSVRLLLTLIAFAISLVPLSVSAQSAGGIGGRPANPDPANPRTQSIFIMQVDRGASKDDTVMIANNTDTRQTIELYAVDGVVSNSGSYTCRQESEARVDMGRYTTIAKNSLVLEAGDTEEVSFTVTMPSDADVGEHNGCIVFQTPLGTQQNEGGVRVQTRQAIRLVATVPGDLHREVTINSFTVDNSEKGNPLYKLSLKNIGNVSADVDAKVTVFSLFGTEAYTNGGGYPVIANQKLELAFEHPSEDRPFFGGWYKASALVRYDKDAGVFGTENTANLVTKTTESEVIYLAPTLAGLAVIIVALLTAVAGAVYFLMRRQSLKELRENGHTHVVKDDETVQSIATAFGISWKKLVAINKIKAPYILKSGTKLHVPAKKTSRRSKAQ